MEVLGVHTVTFFSILVGWIYFVAWALSSYPQIILNWKRKSVVGLSFDFMSFSITGNICYVIFNIVLYCRTCPEKLNDVVSSIHGVILSCTIVFQCLIYESGDQKVSKVTRVVVLLIWLSVFGDFFLLALGVFSDWRKCVKYLGYIKDFCSLVKYTPQAYLNYKRQSTDGFNILGILLDFTGGSLSMAQMVLDGIDQGNWSEIHQDLPKLLLSIESMSFDILFIFQHFYLYRKPKPKEMDEEDWEKRKLLGGGALSVEEDDEESPEVA